MGTRYPLLCAPPPRRRLSDPRRSVVAMSQLTPLTDQESEILELEKSWWQYTGAKETAIREKFGLTPTSYYQAVNALIDRPEAMAHDPITVKRLQRLRADRQSSRSARRLGFDA